MQSQTTQKKLIKRVARGENYNQIEGQLSPTNMYNSDFNRTIGASSHHGISGLSKGLVSPTNNIGSRSLETRERGGSEKMYVENINKPT